MAFPEIQSSILCEAVRQEEGGKLSILGFRGVLPNLDLAISEKPKTLVLLNILGPHEGGTFMMSAVLRDPRGEIIVAPSNTLLTLQTVPREQGAFIATNFGEVVIDKEGSYTFEITADNNLVIKQMFSAFRLLS